MVRLVNDYKGRYRLDFIEVSVQPLNGEHIYVSPFFSLNEAADRIGDLRHEFTSVRYYPHAGALINEALCDSSNDMRLAGAGWHLHHYGPVGLKGFRNPADHLGLIGIKMNMLLARHELMLF